jgi:hypothetical protein
MGKHHPQKESTGNLQSNSFNNKKRQVVIQKNSIFTITGKSKDGQNGSGNFPYIKLEVSNIN